MSIQGLFINNSEKKDSIHISGEMVFECLKYSSEFTLDYFEISKNNRSVPAGYDFYLMNYHPATMSWLETRDLKKKLKNVGTIVLEVSPGDPFVLCPEKDFTFYCVLDPTIKDSGRVFSFPRPLEKVNFDLNHITQQIPVIGSFGFATKGKGFQHVVDAVNKEFEKAIIKINIPYGDFVPDSKEYAAYLADICKKRAKPGVEVVVTNDFMSKEELIQWCASNTLNCFLYDRDMPGLSATTDQAIVSERPLCVSDNDTFRHITKYLPPYPQWSLKECIENSVPLVLQMKKDWSAKAFSDKFEIMLQSMHFKSAGHNGSVELSLKKKRFADKIRKRIKKYKRKFKNLFTSKKKVSGKTKEII